MKYKKDGTLQEQNGGRPPKEITLKELEKLAMMQCTDEEIAAWFEIAPENFIRYHKKRKEVMDILIRGKAKGRASLRHAQFQAAVGGNVTMMIWMGKQLLNQRDQISTEHSGEVTLNDREVRDKIISKLVSLAARDKPKESAERPN